MRPFIHDSRLKCLHLAIRRSPAPASHSAIRPPVQRVCCRTRRCTLSRRLAVTSPSPARLVAPLAPHAPFQRSDFRCSLDRQTRAPRPKFLRRAATPAPLDGRHGRGQPAGPLLEVPHRRAPLRRHHRRRLRRRRLRQAPPRPAPPHPLPLPGRRVGSDSDGSRAPARPRPRPSGTAPAG